MPHVGCVTDAEAFTSAAVLLRRMGMAGLLVGQSPAEI